MLSFGHSDFTKMGFYAIDCCVRFFSTYYFLETVLCECSNKMLTLYQSKSWMSRGCCGHYWKSLCPPPTQCFARGFDRTWCIFCLIATSTRRLIWCRSLAMVLVWGVLLKTTLTLSDKSPRLLPVFDLPSALIWMWMKCFRIMWLRSKTQDTGENWKF